MRVSDFVASHTYDLVPSLRKVWLEVVELLEEIVRLNPKGIREEFGDIFHMFQLWLYSYGWNGRLWMWCARKFLDRQAVWQRLFDYTGVLTKARSSRNYMREEKVIEVLGDFGVPLTKAREAYKVVVLAQHK